MIKNKLKFGNGNAKLSKAIMTFSLPAGYSCPQANECLSFANRETGKIKDGQNTKFRCFSASTENIFPNVRESRWNNYELLLNAKSVNGMTELIHNSIPVGTLTIRCHVSGDFFNETYFLAWLNVALNNPQMVIYGYTKCVNYLVKYKKQIPKNFRFTASFGGKLDSLIKKHKLISAKVVYSVNEAKDLGLEIDHDDSHSINFKAPYALLLHGVQAKDTPAAKALSALKHLGLTGYSNKNKSKNEVAMNKVYVDLVSVKPQPMKFTMKKKQLV